MASPWRVHRLSIAVFLLGLVATGGLSLAALAGHESNEDRLIDQRVREATSVFTAVIPNIQTPLASAAELAEATSGRGRSFERLMQPLVGEGKAFVSAAFWRVDESSVRPLSVVGKTPQLTTRTRREIRAFLTRASKGSTLSVIELLDGSSPRLGYGFSSNRAAVRYVAYAESELPANRTAVPQRGSAFADLDYALYLGNSQKPEDLMVASTPKLPLHGRHASNTVDFGDNKLTLVMSPRGELGGSLLQRLPWIIAALGLPLALGAAFLCERLLRRREHAEVLALENARLYANERSIAQTLQQSLLPDRLPEPDGAEFAVRYQPGVEGVDIGGDWYDAMQLDENRYLLVVGDVSGRGLRAGAIMAALRHAIRAYAVEGYDPGVILTKLGRLLDVARDGHFATVLCAIADINRREVVVANAGHPDALLVDGDGAHFVETPVGVPVGVADPPAYRTVTVEIPPRGTLLAFTDGLFERRGEILDVGLGRVREAAEDRTRTLDELLSTVMDTAAAENTDDTAILGVRWRN
jgi:hypothetical protein